MLKLLLLLACAAKNPDLASPIPADDAPVAQGFDLDRARLAGPNLFPPLNAQEPGRPLAELNLEPTEPILLLSRDTEVRAFLLRHVAWAHVAQGDLAGEPYLVAF